MNFKLSEDDRPDSFSKVLFINKDIYILGEITPNSAGEFLAALNMADQGDGEINVYICSMGGWCEGGLAMYDAIKSTRHPVKTIATGAVYSSAILPYIAGDLRLVQKSAKIFLHEISVSVSHELNPATLESATKETRILVDMFSAYISSACKLSKHEVTNMCKAETYISAEEAVQMGLAHQLIDYTKNKVSFKSSRATLAKAKAKRK